MRKTFRRVRRYFRDRCRPRNRSRLGNAHVLSDAQPLRELLIRLEPWDVLGEGASNPIRRLRRRPRLSRNQRRSRRARLNHEQATLRAMMILAATGTLGGRMTSRTGYTLAVGQASTA
jgi:hypothetical protein